MNHAGYNSFSRTTTGAAYVRHSVTIARGVWSLGLIGEGDSGFFVQDERADEAVRPSGEGDIEAHRQDPATRGYDLNSQFPTVVLIDGTLVAFSFCFLLICAWLGKNNAAQP